MSEKELEQLSAKLNVLIALSLRQLVGDADFTKASGRSKRGVGDQARYLANMGLDSNSIAAILGAPVKSVRTLLTPKRSK
jgi:hypothetical protein